MEETLTLEELMHLLDYSRKAKHEDRRFAAALKGIDIDENNGSDDAFERVKQRADAHLAGRSEEEHVFDTIGIEVESDY